MIEPNACKWNTRFKPLIWGFTISFVFTLIAYYIVVQHLLVGWKLITAVISLAISQGIAQLVFYLHLGIESKPRWNLMIFLFMVLIMIIVLGGSMWIMRNLDYNLMP